MEISRWDVVRPKDVYPSDDRIFVLLEDLDGEYAHAVAIAGVAEVGRSLQLYFDPDPDTCYWRKVNETPRTTSGSPALRILRGPHVRAR
jgi:hypothetical protein